MVSYSELPQEKRQGYGNDDGGQPQAESRHA